MRKVINSKSTMRHVSDLRNELDTYSENVSKRVQFLALGVIGALWAILNAEDIQISEVTFFFETQSLLRVAFASAGLTLFFDLLQYFLAYFVNSRAYARLRRVAEENESEPPIYTYDADFIGYLGVFQRYGSNACWYLKFFFGLLSGALLIIISFSISLIASGDALPS